MPLYQTILFLIAGAILLWKGGDLLVAGAVRLGNAMGVSPGMAGVFILGFGTSFPELVVSSLAAYKGDGAIAIGNVIGSNIANVGLILGATALIATVPVNRFILKLEIPVCLLASFLALYLVRDGSLVRHEALILLGAFAVYAIFAILTSDKRDTPEPDETTDHRVPWNIVLTVLGLAAVLGGASLFLEGAVDVAERLGMSKAVIGETVVALGTSLPELGAALAAARANQLHMALGNVIGSNIFNLLLVLGAAGSFANQSVGSDQINISFPIMIALAAVPLVVGAARRAIGRATGVLLLMAYIGFIVYSALQVA